jgi:hypothetical protein
MRRMIVLVLLPAFAFSAFAVKPAVTELVSVAQLEQALASAQGASDGAVAKQLAQMRLTERLTDDRLAHLYGTLPGHQSREQLLVLADESAFRELPSEDRLPTSAPDPAAQTEILARTAAYVKDQIGQWPSFSALRSTTRFEGTATVLASGLQDDLGTPVGARLLRSPSAPNWECPGTHRLPSRRLDPIERVTVPVIYRRGHALHSFSGGGEFSCSHNGVNTSDEFGEILILVPLIAGDGKAEWSHWEAGAEGPLAVFKFMASVHFSVSVVSEESTAVELEGELAVDPKDGSVRRLTEVRRWQRNSYPREYDTAVEFGPIAMGGVRLLLPIRRVAMFLTPILKPASDNRIEGYYRKFHLEKSPLQEYLNDVRFGEYRAYSSPESHGGSTADVRLANQP